MALTGWQRLDPLVALAVAVNIVWAGGRIVRDSVHGLMDAALPAQELETVRKVLARHEGDGIQFHAVRTRRAGTRRFVSFHVLVPGGWTVQRGHDLLEAIESEVRAALPNATVFTHLEPVEDPSSWDDVHLDRGTPNGNGGPP